MWRARSLRRDSASIRLLDLTQSVEASPSAAMMPLEAQVSGRRDSGVRTRDGVAQFEEGVAPTLEAFVERAAETVESIGTVP
jgi:hypothetical protein